MRQATAAVVGIVLLAGIIGVVVTFLAYILAGLLMLGLFGLLMHGMMSINEKRMARRHAAASSAAPEQAALLNWEPNPHPAWTAAIAKRRGQRERLVDQYVDLEGRIRRLRNPNPWANAYTLIDTAERAEALERELVSVRGLMRQMFGNFPKHVGRAIGGDYIGVEVEPPRDEVIHLDREFMLTGDCRYGHWDEHAIDDSGNGRVLRRCTYCEPNTRWTERV